MEFRSLALTRMMVVYCCMYANLVSSATTPAATLLPNETDHLALMAFKDAITDDPYGVLSSWNESLHFCQWVGISCSNRHQQRVVSLSLPKQKLGGVLSPHIGNLSFLKVLTLFDNFFTGEIPRDVTRLSRLQFLGLANNTFEGEIPVNLSYCSNLRSINLGRNKLKGKIPVQLGLLEKLKKLWLRSNNFIGLIPNSLGNLSSLEIFDLEENILSGTIPRDLDRLQRLSFFGVSDNRLTGIVPHQLYNISTIDSFQVSRNKLLQGSLPFDIGLTLPNLQWLALGINQFTGTIPISLLNCSKLAYIEIVQNMFSGSVPQNLGRLQHLSLLYGGGNNFGSGEGSQGYDLQFLSSLTNCTNLISLEMGSNALTGSLPNSIANLSSQLQRFGFENNHIHGGIPSGIGDLVRLNYLNLAQNNISGHIPATIRKLQGLQELYLPFNKLTGRIPSLLGNLTQLSILDLHGNNLNGNIPSSLGNCQKLTGLDLSFNHLTGIIPIQLFDLRSLSRALNLYNNYLSGPLPLEVGRLNNLVQLAVSDNKLSGVIPATLGKCVLLTSVYIQGNMFEKEIPESLSDLRGIELLDFSHNKLTGRIPEFLGTLQFLNALNLSFNDFEGAVPLEGVFKNASALDINGNQKLCGGFSTLGLPLCLTLASKRKQTSLPLKVIAPIIAASLCLTLLASFLIIHCKRRVSITKPSSTLSFSFRTFRISYMELLNATDTFSDANLLGVGTYGSVYKGTLHKNGMIVAVKVLNLQQRGALKSFIAECDVLRNVRHRNLVKVITSCSSVDLQGNDFKALVFEFMPNGDLEKWLYPEPNEQCEMRNLNLLQRLNIAIDVASALEHLHHRSQPTIIHCDLKPSNVLLDSDMIAHVGDFGLAKILSTVSDSLGQCDSETNSLAVKGSIGYVAPEYGTGSEVSMQGDVYSYGILLIEMFTGKRPTNDLFRDGLTLHRFANMSNPEKVVEIIDPRLLVEEGNRGRNQECSVSVLKVGVACSAESPNERMQMGDVVVELNSIRDFLSTP